MDAGMDSFMRLSQKFYQTASFACDNNPQRIGNGECPAVPVA
jgi:hypothetical protein